MRSPWIMVVRAVLGALLALTVPAVVEAATYRVAGMRGSDQTGDGSVASPWKTIYFGVQRMAPGDTLEIEGILGGAYNDYICNVPSGEGWGRPTILRGLPGVPVVVMPLVDTGSVVSFASNGACLGNKAYIIVDNMVFDGRNVSHSVITIKDGSHHIRISNSEVRNAVTENCLFVGHGPAPYPHSDYNELLNLHVHHCGLGATSTMPHGLYLTSSFNRVENSRFHDIQGYGIHIYNQYYLQPACGPGAPALCCDPADPHRCEASRNVVRDTETFGSRNRDGILVSCGVGNIVHGCLTHDNALSGLRVDYLARSTSLYDNVAYNNGGAGIAVGYNAGSNVFDTTMFGNIAYHTEGTQEDIFVAPSATGTVRDFNFPRP